jgi:hypothetical protein
LLHDAIDPGSWDLIPRGDSFGIAFNPSGSPDDDSSDLLSIRQEGIVSVRVLEITGGSDLAEPFEIASDETIEPGMVLTLDENSPGKLRTSVRAYDPRVAGIVCGAGNLQPGVILRSDHLVGRILVAICGRAYCRADASAGSIRPGDLLTTSQTPGYAMRADDHKRSRGSVLGKAMSPLDHGRGLVLTLVTLQ